MNFLLRILYSWFNEKLIITITSKNTAGPFHVYIERIDQSTGCNAFVVIPVTVSAPTVAFDCTAANILGGNVAADGTLTTPTSTGPWTPTGHGAT